ncbi:MAG: hypothetical protein GXP09_03180 [Gammaproteobacteria bacterium]|nr:hypothetical protein [Gammaproteobacteria bacterium]
MEDKKDSQFNRVSISTKDFQEAQEYLGELSEGQSAVVQRGLLVAAIVSYSRPFTTNRSGEKSRATNTLQSNMLKVLSKSAKELHEKILGLRHTGVAHSDFDRKPTSRVPFEGSGVLIRSKTFNPLSEGIDIEMFKEMAKNMESCCVTKLIELNRSIGSNKYPQGGAAKP